MNGYAMDSFPAVLKHITLKGIRGPNVGFHGLSYADVYDFHAGDEFEKEQKTILMGPGGSHEIAHYTITARTDFTDKVQYTWNYETQTRSWITYDWVFASGSSGFDYYKNMWVDNSWADYWMEEYYTMDLAFPGCGDSVQTFKGQTHHTLIHQCPGTDCMSEWTGSGMVVTFTASAKAGLVLETKDVDFSDETYQLLYLKVNGVECGQVILGHENLVFDTEVKIYPNPAGKRVNIETGKLQGRIQAIFLSDMTGKKLPVVFSGNNSVLDIDLSTIGAGTYWIGFETAEGLVSKKLVVLP